MRTRKHQKGAISPDHAMTGKDDMSDDATPPRRARLPRPERRTKKDLIAAGAIAGVAVLTTAGVWLTSDAHNTEHRLATEPLQPGLSAQSLSSETLPELMATAWSVADESDRPAVFDGGVLVTQGSTAQMIDVRTGQPVWSYDNGHDVCGTAEAWNKAIVIFDTSRGCSEAISFTPADGSYLRTRAALGSPEATVIRSNDAVGVASEDRVELWRSDLVRQIEVGRVEAPVRTDDQKYTECSFTSALTRKNLLATMQHCPEATFDGEKLVRLFGTDPEDSRAPETIHEYRVPAGSELVAINQDHAALYAPGGLLQVLDESGEFTEHKVKPSPLIDGRAANGDTSLTQPLTADLPHNMTWWDGERLVAFMPSTLAPVWEVPGAVGTGAAFGNRALIPVRDGIAVVDWDAGKVLRTIAVSRENEDGSAYDGPVILQVVAGQIIEKRGDQIVALR